MDLNFSALVLVRTLQTSPTLPAASSPAKLSFAAKNGIKEIVEVKVGYDGIVLANSRSSDVMKLSRKDIFTALAKDVPVDGKLVANPYTTWNQVNSALPNVKIEVLGPPPYFWYRVTLSSSWPWKVDARSSI